MDEVDQDGANDGDNLEGFPQDLLTAPRMSPELETQERASLTDKEAAAAFSDVYGKLHPSERTVEEAVTATELELGKIPSDCKESFLRAQRAFPFLFVATSHIKVFLEAEGFDPQRAALRIVRYWESRELILGDAAFELSAFATPTDEDYLRLNGRKVLTTSDPDVDDEICFIICELMREWSEKKVVYLRGELDKMRVKEKTAFLDALSRKPESVGTEDEMLEFLRSVNFDPKRAAQKMVNYWEMKYFLFGRDHALERVTMEWLSKE